MDTTRFSELAPAGTTLLLHGVIGSRAYGLDNDASDTDTLAVYAERPEFFLGLQNPDAGSLTKVMHVVDGDDSQAHEVSKFLRLALKANPTCSELLWLQEHLTCTAAGAALVAMRGDLLSAGAVRSAYLGYCQSQVALLRRTQKEKAGRHVMRLALQATTLWKTGELKVRVTDPQRCFDFGRQVMEDPQMAADLVDQLADILTGSTPLPAQANRDRADAWLLDFRREQFRHTLPDSAADGSGGR